MLVLDNTTDFYSVSIALKRRIIRELSKHFDSSYKLDSRVQIVGDLDKFRYKDDVSLWSQAKSYSPKEFTLYWDDEFICRINTSHHIELVMTMFWQGLKEAYKAHKIGLLERLPDVVDETVKDQLKKLDDMKLTTPEEKHAKDVVKKLIKRKHGRKPARSA